jgi:O-antigen/teichoic acid export membrane protein/GT2 family glycosyltransferase
MPSISVANESAPGLRLGAGSPSRGRRRLSLRQNSALNLAGTALGLGLGLLVTPYVVIRLGLHAFGFVALISAFSQYAAVFDFGVGTTVMRAIGHHDEQSDVDAIRRKAASALWSSTAFAVVLVAGVALALMALPAHAFGSLADWKPAVLAVALSVGCTSLASVFQAFPSGMGRWDLTNASSVTNQVAYSVIVVIALSFTRSIGAVAIATAASGLAGLLVAYVIYRRRWHLRLTPRAARRGELWGLWSYGLSMQSVQLVSVVNAQADKPVLLAFASLKFVGLYEIGSRITLAIRALAVTAFGPLSAEAARTFSRGGRKAVARLYESSYRSTLLLGLVPLTALFALSYVFVLVWVGADYRPSGVIALILGCGYAVNLATGAGTSIAMGAGRADLDRNYSILGFVLNIALTIALGLLVGGWGVIAATALGQIISSFWLLHTVDAWLGTSILRWRNLTGDRLCTWLLMLAVALGAAATALAGAVPIDDRLTAAVVLLGTGALFLLAWGSALIRRGVVSPASILRRTPAAAQDEAAADPPAIETAALATAQAATDLPASLAVASVRPPAPDPAAPAVDEEPAPSVASVIVISHNGAGHIGETLARLRRQTIAPERYDLIVVDDGSTDGTADLARAAGARVVRLASNQGPGAARAAGVAAATTEIVAFTDDDCLPEAEWLQEILAPFSEAATDGVGGHIEPLTEPGVIARFFAIRNPWSPLSDDLMRSTNRWFRLWLYLRSIAHADTDPRGSGLFSVAGGNMAFRRSALESVGGFASSHRVSEETELCRRLHNRAGGARIVYQRSAVVAHRFDAGLLSVLRRAHRYGGGTARMARTHDDVGLIAFPFPLISGAALLAALMSRRRAALLCALVSPLALYFGWTRRAAQDRDPGTLAFPYLQLAMESATMFGELGELRRLGSDPRAGA